MIRRTFLAASVTSVLALGVGGGAEAQTQSRWNATGTITQIRRERSSITIRHEAIEGLMPAMTMPFAVEDPALFEGLSVGDRVDFTLSREAGGRYVIRSIRRR